MKIRRRIYEPVKGFCFQIHFSMIQHIDTAMLEVCATANGAASFLEPE